MALGEFTKRDIAVGQLELAIRIFLDGGNMFAALTLAGAAEEILGKQLLAMGGRTALNTVQAATAAVSRALGHTAPSDKRIADIANFARNAVKHFDTGGPPTVRIDPEEEAAEMIDRAITNFFRLTEDQTELMGEFYRRRYPGT